MPVDTWATRAADPWLSARMAEYAHIRRAEAQLHPAVARAVKEFLAQARTRAIVAAAFQVPAHLAFANDDDTGHLPDESAWRALVDRIIGPISRRLWRASYRRTTSREPDRQADADHTTTLAARLAGFRQAVADRLRRTLRIGRERGETPAQLRARVANLMVLEEWDGQVMTMTRTETMTALNAGAYAGAFDEQERTGEPWEKRWQATDDQRVRHTHHQADGQIRPLHDPFDIGGHRLQFPGDPKGPAGEVINCRCAARYGPAADPALTAAAPHPDHHTHATQEGEPTAMATPTDTHAPGPVQVSPSGRWRGALGFMDEWSADQRMLVAPGDGVRSRPLPLPLLVQGTLANGHDGGKLGVGVIDRIWTEGNTVYGEGRFDLDDPVGAQLARKVGLGFIRFVSLDVDDAEARQVLVDADGQVVENGDPGDQSLSIGDVYSNWRVMGATLLAHPAFPNAAIALADADGQALTAAAFAEIVGYDPEWGCVKAAGDAWETADCTDPDAVPANPTGDGPFDPEAAPDSPPDDLAAVAQAPGEEDEPQDAQEPPSDIEADAEEAAEELDPDAEGSPGCVTQAEDGTWVPADCEAPGAVPANADGTGPAEQAEFATDPEPQPDPDPEPDPGGEQEEVVINLATDNTPPADCEPCRAVTITAAATGTMAPGWTPPAEWFQPPNASSAHAIRVDVTTGQVSGYLAAWGTCHVGYKNRCVPPPRSHSDYAYYNVRPVNTSDGTVYCGLLTMGTGHAALSATAASAMAHYDNTGTQAAVVRVGEDNHGIWAAGAVLPFLSAEDRLRLSLASFSGDWREVRGGAELVAALAVNSPGFPLAAQKTGANNQPYALVAAGALQPEPPTQEFELRQTDPVDAATVAALVVEQLDARQARKERTAAATGRLAALRQDHTTRTRQAFDRRVAAAKGKVVRVQRPKAGEPPMELVGLGTGLPTPSTQDIHLARNWVDEQGGLPPYIKRISKHLEAKGMDKGRAIATAVNAAKKMCKNGDLQWPGIQQVNPGSKAEACTAVERWEAMKAAARAS